MTSINRKLGLKAAGKRAMMKLPDDKQLRARLTAAKCPACGQRGARLSTWQADAVVTVWCSWCNHHWELA